MIQERFLNWNRDNSISHSDYEGGNKDLPGAESFFHVFGDEFHLTTHACALKDYTLKHEGINLLKEERSYEFLAACPEIEDDEDFERHSIEFVWKVTSDEGFFYIEVDNKAVGIQWSNRTITDLQGTEANIYKVGDDYKVSERLTTEQSERLALINRFEKLKYLAQDQDLKDTLRFKISELKYAKL